MSRFVSKLRCATFVLRDTNCTRLREAQTQRHPQRRGPHNALWLSKLLVA